MMCITPVVLLLSTATYAQWDPEVIWERNGDEPTAHFGSLVFPLGDQNEDGFADWGVFSAGQNSDDYRTARIQFFHGGNPPSQQPYVNFVVEDGMYFNQGSSCGDLNGDGYVDWYIVKLHSAFSESLHACVYFGGGADTTADVTFWIPRAQNANHIDPYGLNIGYKVNFNADGFDDLAFFWNDGAGSSKYISFYFGGVSMDGLADWTVHDLLPECYGDVNGDNITDFVGLQANTTMFYFGSPQPDSTPDITLHNIDGLHGTLADFNGDGFADLIEPFWPGGRLYFGGTEMSNIPSTTLTFGCGNGPHETGTVGDINGDGIEDIMISDPSCNRLSLYLGYFWVNPDPVWSVADFEAPYNLIGIWRGFPIGDVNGDGIDDWAIGATSDEAGGVPGRVVILAGDSSLHVPAETHPELPQELIVSIYPNPCNALATVEFELPHGVQNAALSVFNLLGQVIKQKEISSTDTRYTLDAGSLASGIYLIQVEAKDLQQTQKLVVLK